MDAKGFAPGGGSLEKVQMGEVVFWAKLEAREDFGKFMEALEERMGCKAGARLMAEKAARGLLGVPGQGKGNAHWEPFLYPRVYRGEFMRLAKGKS